jgi:hypothetical protein
LRLAVEEREIAEGLAVVVGEGECVLVKEVGQADFDVVFLQDGGVVRERERGRRRDGGRKGLSECVREGRREGGETGRGAGTDREREREKREREREFSCKSEA